MADSARKFVEEFYAELSASVEEYHAKGGDGTRHKACIEKFWHKDLLHKSNIIAENNMADMPYDYQVNLFFAPDAKAKLTLIKLNSIKTIQMLGGDRVAVVDLLEDVDFEFGGTKNVHSTQVLLTLEKQDSGDWMANGIYFRGYGADRTK